MIIDSSATCLLYLETHSGDCKDDSWRVRSRHRKIGLNSNKSQWHKVHVGMQASKSVFFMTKTRRIWPFRNKQIFITNISAADHSKMGANTMPHLRFEVDLYCGVLQQTPARALDRFKIRCFPYWISDIRATVVAITHQPLWIMQKKTSGGQILAINRRKKWLLTHNHSVVSHINLYSSSPWFNIIQHSSSRPNISQCTQSILTIPITTLTFLLCAVGHFAN